jgi:hypothetical protein
VAQRAGQTGGEGPVARVVGDAVHRIPDEDGSQQTMEQTHKTYTLSHTYRDRETNIQCLGLGLCISLAVALEGVLLALYTFGILAAADPGAAMLHTGMVTCDPCLPKHTRQKQQQRLTCTCGSVSKYSIATRPSMEEIAKLCPSGEQRIQRV